MRNKNYTDDLDPYNLDPYNFDPTEQLLEHIRSRGTNLDRVVG